MSEQTKLNSNLKFLFPCTPPPDLSYMKRTFHSSKGVYVSSSLSNNKLTSSPTASIEENMADSYLSLSEFCIIDELGHGAFGVVYKAFNDKWDEYLALKIISLPQFLDEETVNMVKQQVLCEKFLLQQVNLLKNRHFIKFYSIFKDTSDPGVAKLILAMENGAGNMNDILFYRKSYSQKEIVYIMHYLSEALHLCQTHFIANRDIKPENFILVRDDTNELYYKIADFGIGCQLSPEESTIFVGDCPGYTELYAAPELLYNMPNIMYCPFKADVYSLGVSVLKMMGLSSDQIRDLKRNNDFDIIEPRIRKGYEKLLAIVKKMMNKEPNDRPNFYDVSRIFGSMPKMKPYDREFFKKLEEKIDNLSLEQKVMKCEEMFCLYIKFGDSEKCIYFAELCLKLNSRLKGEINYTTALWNFYLGCFSQEENHYESAVKHYKKAYEILFEADEAFSLLTADIFNNISLIFREQRKYTLAFKLLDKALKIRKNILGRNSTDYADSLNNLGSIYQLFNLRKALECYEQAYLISISCAGDENEISLIFLNNMADIHRKIGNLGESIKLNKKCMKLKEKIYADKDISLSFTYNNLSLAYLKTGKLEKALVYQNKSLEIKKKMLKENDVSLSNGFHNLAIIYESLEKLEESIENHQNALKIRKKHFGKHHSLTKESSQNLIRIIEKKQNLSKDFGLETYEISTFRKIKRKKTNYFFQVIRSF